MATSRLRPLTARKHEQSEGEDKRPIRVGRLPFLLKLAEREVGKELDRRLAHTGLTKAQLGVLRVLVRLKTASSAALARTVFVSPQAMVNIAAKLDLKGFIERKTSATSARTIEATVTPSGRAAYEQGMQVMEGLDELFLSEFSERELATFLGYLERCVDVLQRQSSAR